MRKQRIVLLGGLLFSCTLLGVEYFQFLAAERKMRTSGMGRINRANIRKTIYYLKRNGILNTWYAARERMEETKKEPYHYQPPAEQELMRQRANPPAYQGLISVVVPAYHTAPQYLRELTDSLLQQTYSNWELILADASADESVEKVIKTYSDERIHYVRLKGNAGISRNTNCALEYASGEYIGLLDHDDVLTEDALYKIATAVARRKQAGAEVKMLYSDEDKCDSGRTLYFEPNRKEKFNLDLLLSNNYICHFLVMESRLMKELGFRTEYDGAQDYDLVLRAAERLMERPEQIVHIPKVLYHWRCHSASTAENPQSKQYAYEAGRRALQDFADRQGWNARVAHLRHLGFYKIEYITHVFQNRRDIGAVGGRVLQKGKVVGGRLSEDGVFVYEGLPKAYSGYLHRAVLSQDADAVDIRCIQIRTECIPIFEEVTGVSYRQAPGTNLFDASALPKDTDYRQLSAEFGKALRNAGYRILYDPSVTARWGQ